MSMLFKRIKDWATTITAFRTGDVIAVDGPDGTAKMSKDNLLEQTAQNALAGNVAPAFDETGGTAYSVGTPVSRGGKTYVFKVNHSGAWDASHVIQRPLSQNYLNVPCRAIFTGSSTNPSDLNDVKDNLYQFIQAVTSSSVANLPEDYKGASALLVVSRHDISASIYEIVQTLYELDGSYYVWTRIFNSIENSWSGWKCSSIAVRRKEIIYDWAQNPSDLNDFKNNVIIRCDVSSGTQTLNFPSDYTGDGLLIVTRTDWPGGWRVLQKLTKTNTGTVWYRIYTYLTSTQTGSWNAWSKTSEPITVRSNGIIYDWAQNPADLNAFVDSGVIRCAVSSATQTQHFPSDYSGDGILTITKSKFPGGWQAIQRLVKNSNSQAWTRIYTFSTSTQTGSWDAWSKASEPSNLVTIGVGKMYTTLRAGFSAAFAQKNCKVVVYPGVYDLTVECANVLATTLTNNFTPCKLGNGMHVVFMDGAKVKCNIEKGEMSNAQFNSIKERFEPLAFYYSGDNGDFVIENLDIESKNCRYCVHDDQGGSTKPYVHKYINCKMYRTNSNITSSDNFVPCIGGGLGQHGTIVIEGGYYQSEPVVGNPNIMSGDLDYQQIPIAYHNGNVADAQSSITLRDVFFVDKGYFQTQDYGPSTLKTKCYISGCRFGLPPMVGVRTETTNFELTAAWNNDIAQDGEWQDDPSDPTKRIFVPTN